MNIRVYSTVFCSRNSNKQPNLISRHFEESYLFIWSNLFAFQVGGLDVRRLTSTASSRPSESSGIRRPGSYSGRASEILLTWIRSMMKRWRTTSAPSITCVSQSVDDCQPTDQVNSGIEHLQVIEIGSSCATVIGNLQVTSRKFTNNCYWKLFNCKLRFNCKFMCNFKFLCNCKFVCNCIVMFDYTFMCSCKFMCDLINE